MITYEELKTLEELFQIELDDCGDMEYLLLNQVRAALYNYIHAFELFGNEGVRNKSDKLRQVVVKRGLKQIVEE